MTGQSLFFVLHGWRALALAVAGIGQYSLMSGSDEPTWRLTLLAAEHLTASRGEFRLQDLVVEVQRMDPGRGRGTIQPIVQGMTSNEGSGPPSPCGKPLLRVGHGLYEVAKSTTDLCRGQSARAPQARSQPRPGQSQAC